MGNKKGDFLVVAQGRIVLFLRKNVSEALNHEVKYVAGEKGRNIF